MIKRTLGPLQFPDELLNFITNPKIGLRAKGLLLHMLAQEDTFELNTKDLCIYNKDNPSIVNGAIKDLEKLGYIEVINKDKPNMSYIIYDSPQINVSTKFREQEHLKKAADNATKNYIKKYLTPDRHFKRDRSIDTYLQDLQSPEFPVDWNYIQNYICDWLTYDEFLLTEYWEIISIWKKVHSNFTCQFCGKKFNMMSKLNIHHKTYETHGMEHIPGVLENDLICLCESCHKTWHEQNSLTL